MQLPCLHLQPAVSQPPVLVPHHPPETPAAAHRRRPAASARSPVIFAVLYPSKRDALTAKFTRQPQGSPSACARFRPAPRRAVVARRSDCAPGVCAAFFSFAIAVIVISYAQSVVLRSRILPHRHSFSSADSACKFRVFAGTVRAQGADENGFKCAYEAKFCLQSWPQSFWEPPPSVSCGIPLAGRKRLPRPQSTPVFPPCSALLADALAGRTTTAYYRTRLHGLHPWREVGTDSID